MLKVVFLFLTLFISTAHATSGKGLVNEFDNKATCENAGLFSGGGLINKICWNCIAPIQFMGVDITNMFGKTPSVKKPEDASKDLLCICNDFNGVPVPGFLVGMWEPAYLVETTRTPGCMLSMEGTKIDLGGYEYGTAGNQDTDSINMKHYHFYKFPLLYMLDMMTKRPCVYDGAFDFDMLGMSEITDPLWYSDSLAFYATPEAAVVTNPVAQIACSADAVAVSAGQRPMKSLFWCAGAWGSLYPFTGNTLSSTGPITNSSIQAARVLATNHRRAFMWGTVGNEAMCKGKIKPVFPKQQYKYNMFWPRAESNKSHQLGETEMSWGANRYVPVTGEDQVYNVFRWTDCCYRMM